MSKPTGLSRQWLLAGTIMTSLVGFAPAMAQDTPPTEAAPTEAPDTAPAESADSGEFVITGSRIKGKEYTSAAPVTVITAERSSAAGLVSAAEILQTSSVANGSGQINSTFTGYVVDGGGGINSVSLRGLGAQRSLVLLNGRRMPPAGVSGTVGAVDLNTIPDSAVSRYEIVKDGASSIYGSDAVAGVINVITRKNFEGLELAATTRISQHGGGDTYNLSALWGKSFDKGHLTVSASAYEREALMLGQREALNCPQDYIFNSDGTRADIVTTRPGESGYKCWGNLVGGVAVNNQFFREIRPGSTTSIGGVPVTGWYGPVQFADREMDPESDDRTTVISPVKRFTLFVQGEYRPDWANGAELYSELLINRRESEQRGMRYIFPYYGPNSPNNPFGTGTQYDQNNGAAGGAYVYPYFLTPSNKSQEVNVYRGIVGAKGEWGRWSWDTYLSHSISDGKYLNDVVPQDRLFAGIGFDENQFVHVPVCQGVPAGCTPLNLFTQDALFNGTLTPAESDYFFVVEEGKTKYTQTIAEATLTGDLLQLPAGPLGAAFGISYRRDELKDTPGEFSRASNAWGSASAGITEGSDSLAEAFFELEAPIVNGQPFFEDLKINLSGRFSNYDSVGSAGTYKVGFNWAVNNTLRFRGTHGTSFRAPALYEMFLNEQTAFLSQRSVDPCVNWAATTEGQPNKSQTVRDNCAAEGIPGDYDGVGNGQGASALIYYSGSRELNPEESQASTLGFILTPPNTGFKVAVDFWRINVENQILSTGAGVVGACYGQETFPNNGFCDLFERDSDFNIVSVDASYRNIPSELTSGIDITASYTREFNLGTLTMDLQTSYTRESKTQLFPGDTIIDYNGTIADPKWVGSLQNQFKHKDWLFTYTFNYVGESSNMGYREEDGIVNTSYAVNATNINYTDAWTTHDFTVKYTAKDWTIAVGVINLTDEEPPLLSYGDNTGSPARLGTYAFSSQYDPGLMGRQAYFRVSKSF
jgi:iron complex outermembrane recepter protein